MLLSAWVGQSHLGTLLPLIKPSRLCKGCRFEFKQEERVIILLARGGRRHSAKEPSSSPYPCPSPASTLDHLKEPHKRNEMEPEHPSSDTLKVAHMNFPNSVSSEQPDVFIFPAVSGEGGGQSSCIELEELHLPVPS